ncbi:MAG: DUF4288 domain-containing protein [Ignavibacteriales bacterium]|nr:DUF4288 domain-containing protein [Ignavibacteriales bacterium]
MKWFAVHIIMYVKFKEKGQDHYPIWENIVLFRAKSVLSASKKAKKYAQQEEGDSSGTFTWENKPAKWVFAGIRKIVKCQEENEQPTNGTELTYSEFSVSNKSSLNKLVQGKKVTITLVD